MICEAESIVEMRESPVGVEDSIASGPASNGIAAERTGEVPAAVVIVNADDWGLNTATTNRICECAQARTLSSVSAMVFMDDSPRAALLAREFNIDAGIHLNFTCGFTGRDLPTLLVEHHRRVHTFLRRQRYARVVFHPLLVNSFDYVVKAQLEEFARLYGAPPSRLDGHHHMHLCANVMAQKLLPAGTIVRRNQSFAVGEKQGINRWYRRMQDRHLSQRHRTTDYFFDILPTEPPRLKRLLDLARESNVEFEVHPGRIEEHKYLMSGEFPRCAENVVVARGYQLRAPGSGPAAAALHSEDDGQPGHDGHGATGVSTVQTTPHISVCICTYKRPEPLKRLLKDLDRQNTAGLFTYSVVVADNDPEGSAAAAVEEIQPEVKVGIKYCAEPARGIARARNKVIANADGDYLALIDDDEFPLPDWLRILFVTCNRYGVDGVLGPVRRHFDQEPPRWLKKSNLYDRRVNPTGMQVSWKESRTGNVLLRRDVIRDNPAPFRPEFKAGEDQDFFHRKIEEGRTFIWSSDAVVYEVIPPARWKRMYCLRKALLTGATAVQQPAFKRKNLLKSVVAIPLYTLCLPVAFLAGEHHFVHLLIKLCDHAGKLLHVLKIDPIREEYVND